MSVWSVALLCSGAVLLIMYSVAIAARFRRRLTSPLERRTGVGLLGLPRSTSSAWMARVACPLLHPVEAIEEEGEGVGLAEPWISQQHSGVLGEGLWRDGMRMCVLTQPAAPFRILEASPDWLAFCGFNGRQVQGCTLRIVQGGKTERINTRRMLELASRGVGTDEVLTNYTRHAIEFRNHLSIMPIYDHNGFLRCFEVRRRLLTPLQTQIYVYI